MAGRLRVLSVRIVGGSVIEGTKAALSELHALDGEKLAKFAAYQAVRAELLTRVGNAHEARGAYEAILALEPPLAERRWLGRQLARLA